MPGPVPAKRLWLRPGEVFAWCAYGMYEIILEVSVMATIANCHPDNRDNSEVRGPSSGSTEVTTWRVVFRTDHRWFFCDRWTQVLYATHAGFFVSYLLMIEGSNQRQGLERHWK